MRHVALHALPERPGASPAPGLCSVQCRSLGPFPPKCGGTKCQAMVNVELEAPHCRGQKIGAFWKTVSSQITTPFFFLNPWSDVNTKSGALWQARCCVISFFCLCAEMVHYEILDCKAKKKKAKRPYSDPFHLCLPHPAGCNLSGLRVVLFGVVSLSKSRIVFLSVH